MALTVRFGGATRVRAASGGESAEALNVQRDGTERWIERRSVTYEGETLDGALASASRHAALRLRGQSARSVASAVELSGPIEMRSV
ncbi:MAG: hypothetical protein AAFW46_17780, partial [Pseudomonadota bacterium]